MHYRVAGLVLTYHILVIRRFLSATLRSGRLLSPFQAGTGAEP